VLARPKHGVDSDLIPPALISPGSRSGRFIDLYERHYAAVLRYAWRRTGADDAEDVAHEAFAVAWRLLDQIPVSGELPWLYKVAGNLIRNNRRKVQRDSLALADLVPVPEPDHADAVDARQAALAAMESLGERDQELLRLVAWEGLDPGEIGAVLGCSRPAVHIRLYRLRKRLEALLDETHWQKGARP
jgi:RNA polymerase sigma factor (sigma-70 family)